MEAKRQTQPLPVSSKVPGWSAKQIYFDAHLSCRGRRLRLWMCFACGSVEIAKLRDEVKVNSLRIAETYYRKLLNLGAVKYLKRIVIIKKMLGWGKFC